MQVKFEHVNKYFNRHKKNEIHVLNDTNFAIKENGLVALLGPSGCGKTTLLNALGGLDRVQNGNIYIDGKKITGKRQGYIDKLRNEKIGYIFQNYNLIEKMTVFDNVALSLKMIGVKDKEEIKKRVNYILEALNIYRYRRRPANMLSGGERQRVGIARALVKNPKIIIADEPTGNLDSANTIEIMNIIKSISKTKLVILVTHETSLADFYADRIIRVEDGKIISDTKNKPSDNLEYRMDNKIYLKEFSKLDNFNDKKTSVNVYSDNQKVNLTVIVKNNNIYIKSNGNEKVEVIDDDSKIELINDKYQKIDKSIYENTSFDTDILKNNRIKYSSIIKLHKVFSEGIKSILDYSFVKKLLLLGFFASAMFITYSVANIFGVKQVHDKDFITANRNYLVASSGSFDYDDYEVMLKSEDIDYVMPALKNLTGLIPVNNFYQTKDALIEVNGLLATSDYVKKEDIIYGRMPQNDKEVVLDKMTIQNAIDNSYGTSNEAGYSKVKDYLNKEIVLTQDVKVKIVGITDKVEPSIFVTKNSLISYLSFSDEDVYDRYYGYENDEEHYNDYKLYDITIVKGEKPSNLYEIILPESEMESFTLNKTISTKVNGHKLKVVGFYRSLTQKGILTNSDTLLALLVENTKKAIIMPKDETKAVDYLNENDFKTYKLYDNLKNQYIDSKKNAVNAGIIASSIMLIISFIEIYLMVRSSFLSRIKEIGIYRAIGVKKRDIYRMFMGEIIGITTIACVPGVLFMSYCLNSLTSINYVASNFLINPLTIGLSIIIIYIFNLIVGLLPVDFVVRATPAAILARKDLD